MWTAEDWNDYTLIDGCDGEKLERWGEFCYIRPDPQIIWKQKSNPRLWEQADARYQRSSSGGGAWSFERPEAARASVIAYGDLRFHIKPMGFKHMGLFPEQAVNWDFMREQISGAGREIRVLNLFAYTGGASVACASAGAGVCHVDAARGMVAQAKENMTLNGLADHPVRYIVDDAVKFVQREVRRGKRYDALIMDPPSYGRGPGGEVWKIEDELFDLVTLCMQVLSEQPLFFVINTYTTGLSPTTVANLLGITVGERFGGKVSAQEIGLPFAGSPPLVLPCGCTARWQA